MPEMPSVEGFRIIDALGQGGMGTVWRAVQLSTDREVALKLLGGATFMSSNAKTRFEREVKLAARLEHSNIATIYDSGLTRGAYYYAMQLVHGEPLNVFIQSRKLKRKLILKLMQIICGAVQHAHDLGVVHRDLKPGNILVSKSGKPIILDFGLAKALLEEDDQGGTLTLSGDIAGTPAYMAPEQAEGRIADIGPHTDVYALGAILFQLLTGEYPTDLSGTHFQKLAGIVEGRVRNPSDIQPSIDPQLEALLLKALAKDPKERYPSAGDLSKAIKRYLKLLKEGGISPVEPPDAAPADDSQGADTGDFSALVSLPDGEDVDEDSVSVPEPEVVANAPPPAANDPLGALADASVSTPRPMHSEIPVARVRTRQPAKRKPKKPLIVVGGIAAALLLAVVIGAAIMFSGGSQGGEGGDEGGTNSVAQKPNTGNNATHTGTDARPPNDAPPGASAGKHFSLKFNNPEESRVEFPTMQTAMTLPLIQSNQSLTVETWALHNQKELQAVTVGIPQGLYLAQTSGGGKQVLRAYSVMLTEPELSRDAPVKWTHYACVYDRERSEYRFYVDGKIAGKQAKPEGGRTPKAFQIKGAAPDRVGETRLSSVARYDKDFTPKLGHVPDKDTIALYKFDEGRGEVLKDSSGNNHHGKIVNAKWVPMEAHHLDARKVAEWVIASGGNLGTDTKGIYDRFPTHPITKAEDLPDDLSEIVFVQIRLDDTRATGHLSDLAVFEKLNTVKITKAGKAERSLAALKELPGLENVELETAIDGEIMKILGAIPSLKSIRFFRATTIKGEDLAHLQDLPNLIELSLAGSHNVDDAGMKYLAKIKTLRKLELNSTQLSDKGLRELEVLKNLIQLRVANTNVTAAGAERFKRAVPKCWVRDAPGGDDASRSDTGAREVAQWLIANGGVLLLDEEHLVSGGREIQQAEGKIPENVTAVKAVLLPIKNKQTLTRLSDLSAFANLKGLRLDVAAGLGKPDLAALKQFKSLRLIQINGQDISGDCLKHLADMPKLRTIRLGGRWISDDDLAHFKNLTELEMLTIGEAGSVSGPGWANLGNLTNLQVLRLYGSKHFNDGAAKYLGRMTKLRELDIRGTGMADAGLRQLESLRVLKLIVLDGANFTTAALTRLQKALPDCRIRIGGGASDYFKLPESSGSGAR